MSRELHIARQGSEWAVKREGSKRASSVHPTQADAIEAGRRLALRSGGAEVLIHSSDGRIRDRNTIGAAKLDKLKQNGGTSKRPVSRAPRSDGPRTTLRVPALLEETADQLANELGISRNDALLRLATRGAELYEMEQLVETRRAKRWAAVVPGVVDIDHGDFPSPEESAEAVRASRDVEVAS